MNKILPIILIVVFLSSCSSQVEGPLTCTKIDQFWYSTHRYLGLSQEILIKNGSEIKIKNLPDLTQRSHDDFNIEAYKKFKVTNGSRIVYHDIYYNKAKKSLEIVEYHADPKFFSFLPFIDLDYVKYGWILYSCK